jgi:triosephosphate isomerase (TIM)
MRKKIIVANWKMNLKVEQVGELLSNLAFELPSGKAQVVIAPSYVYVSQALHQFTGTNIAVAAQDVSANNNGAFTGEVSASMLVDLGAKYAIIGHSERRQHHNESNVLLLQKIQRCVDNKLPIIFCIGELISQRNNNSHFEVIKEQLSSTVFTLTEAEFSTVVIAYEPVWAIGTGVTATTEQAQEMHKYIRTLIAMQYSTEVSEQTSILYGGSCNANNAQQLFACNDIDGGLIGGASLKFVDFKAIIATI